VFNLIITAALGLVVSIHSFAGNTEEFVRKNSIELISNDLTPIDATVKNFKVITIGEMHGSQEAPQFAFDLYSLLWKDRKNLVLGLEIPSEAQPLVDKFIKSKDRSILKLSSFFIRPSQDGRSSVAMVKLLEDLPKDAIVICFDSSKASSGQERDQQMAENLINAYKSLKPDILIVLAGNIHAGIEVGTPFDPNYLPMSYLLHALPQSPLKLRDIQALRIRYAGGNIWACMGNTEADCKIHQVSQPPSSYSSAVSYKKYFLGEALSGGYNGTLFFKTLTASPPAFR
jgi:hypothetical protein